MAKARSQQDGAPGANAGAGAASAQDSENVGLLSAEAAEDQEDYGVAEGEKEEQQQQQQQQQGEVAAGSARTVKGIKSAVKSSAATASSSFTTSQLRSTDQSPRTPHRVRFDPNPTILHGLTPKGTANSFESSRSPRSDSSSFGDGPHDRHHDDDDDNDSLDDLDFQIDDNNGRSHRTPLLTGIEAPSVALANSPWALTEHDDVHSWAESERQRPKSGLRSAFMNMANSIIGAGIIGQPYAFRQAGLLSGILLLVALTIVVDWTICLIVVNSKLSGANSFQGTVKKCFGKSGLIAISLAQWLFAFGGMVAFGVIVGDTIPHVLQAIWPGLKDMPVLGLLADRKVAIVVFILGVSFPLTLYRDIAKVCLSLLLLLLTITYFGERWVLTWEIACKSQYARPNQHGDYHYYGRNTEYIDTG